MASLQCQAIALNVNLGYNSHIMKKCKKLEEYAQFIACVRDYLAKGMTIEESIDTAVRVCIERGILKELLQYLIRHERREEMERVLEDEEYRERLYREYQL